MLTIFKEQGFIDDTFVGAETAKEAPFSTYALRAKAATEAISKEDLVRVLLMLNKKRGYKSSRKAKTVGEGHVIDGMATAKELHHTGKTPGQWVFTHLTNNGKAIPDFYRSDLHKELDSILAFQKTFYPEFLTDAFIARLAGKNKTQTAGLFKALHIELAENKGKDKKIQSYKWRHDALQQQISPKELAFILTEINAEIQQSSGYLGGISDRSKALYFNNQTVGQYQYQQLCGKVPASLKNQVFYRQDYIDEFEKIWNTQAQYHQALTPELKKKVAHTIIFYQRKLKSQKHLISFCEFEKHHRVIPKSSPLFQEFRMWQNLNHIVINPPRHKRTSRFYLKNSSEI